MAVELEKKWRRPENVPYPNIWLRENGIVIRDVTSDFEPYVVQHMLANFLHDSPLNKSTRAYEDQAALDDNVRMWHSFIFPDRISIVALHEGSPGADLKPVDDGHPPNVLGCNLLYVIHKDDPPVESLSSLLVSAPMRTIVSTCVHFGRQVDVFDKYGVDHYVDAGGLSVSPKSRGNGIGLMLLRARIQLCKELLIPLTKTIFTAIESQKLADRCGFQTIYERNYEDLVDQDGKLLFPGIKSTKAMQLKVHTIK